MTHPLLERTARCGAELDALADCQPCFLTTAEKAELIRVCASLEAKAAALRYRVMVDAGDVVDASPCRDMGQWLAAETGVYRAAASRDYRLAEALCAHPRLVDALQAGAVSRDQAGVILSSLDRLPDGLEVDVLDAAECHLIDDAKTFGPHELRKLGEKVLEVIAPDTWEALEGQRLLAQDERAKAAQRLSLKSRGDGTTQISGRLADAVAIRLARYLAAFANPRQADAPLTVFGDPEGLNRMPYPQRAAEAFGQLLECFDPTRLPIHGGDATTVLVTVDYDQLISELGVATLLDAPDDESEHRITAGEARRLACTAHLVPVVLGTESEVLDVGRAARLFTRAQRKALMLRDETCRTEGCHIPGTWSEAHHWVPWSQGGETDLENAVLLCSYHHHLAHNASWRADRLANGDVRFVLRT